MAPAPPSRRRLPRDPDLITFRAMTTAASMNFAPSDRARLPWRFFACVSTGLAGG